MAEAKAEPLTDAQLDAAFVAVLGGPMRKTDLAAIEVVGRTPRAVAEYIWDHWMGEPEIPTVDELTDAVIAAVAAR